MREKGRKKKRMKERRMLLCVSAEKKKIPFENFVSKIVVLSGMCRSFRFTKGKKGQGEKEMIMVRKSARKRDETFVNPKKIVHALSYY